MVSVKSLCTSSLTFFFSLMEQEGSLFGRLPFFTEKWEQKRTNMMPHPLHRAELGAPGACRQHLPLLCFPTEQTQESCSLTACRAPLEKEPFAPSLNTVCLPLSEWDAEGRLSRFEERVCSVCERSVHFAPWCLQGKGKTQVQNLAYDTYTLTFPQIICWPQVIRVNCV